MQGDRYIQVNFADNIRQLKIFGKLSGDRNGYKVTAIYRAVIHKTQFDGIYKRFPDNPVRK